VIEKKFAEYARNLTFVVNKGGFNPARPHSLRSAFRSRLTGKMDGDLIEFFMGHEIGQAKKAYINLPDEELRELYSGFESELSIETISRDVLINESIKFTEINKEYQEKQSKMETTIHTLGNLLNQQTANSSASEYLRALSPNGKCVIIGFSTIPHMVFQVGLIGSLLTMTGNKKIGTMGSAVADQKDLLFIKELIETGKVVPVIDRRYPLSETAEAIRYLEEGHAKGKVVITMDHSENN